MVQDTQQEAKPGLLALVQHYWRVLLKWKWTAGIFAFTCVAVAIAYSFLVPPVYTAVGTIWIEEGPRVLPFEEIQSFGDGSSLSSHTLLLTSRSLASDVIDKLKLSENPDFAGKPKPGLPPPDPADPIYREKLIQRFLSNVTVTAKGQSRLVDVSFSNRDPRLAADILNALFDGYVEMIVSKRYATSEQATRYLNDQIAELRTEIEERERKLNEYGSRKDIMPLSTAEASTVARIGDYSRALTEAQLERINKLNYYNQLKNAPLGEIPSAPEGSVIERLREQYINLRRQYETRLNTVSPDYPDMRRMKSELDSATEALQNETQNLIRNALAEYQAALRKEQSLQNLLDGQKNQAYKASGDSVVYNSLKVELDSRKALLEALSKRQSETDVSARLKGLDSLTVWIVDKAAYPLKPASPNKRKNALLGLILGMAGGVGLAIGIEYLNHTVRTAQDVAREVGIPLMGSIPAFESEAKPKGPRGEFRKILSMLAGPGAKEKKVRKKRRSGAESQRDPLWLSNGKSPAPSRETIIELITVREPQSIQAESFRSLRTALLVSSPPGRIKAILVTSPLAREGKSSTTSNLGAILAEASKRVVIVDADLRKPRQAKIFGVNIANAPGLSRYLSSNMDAAEIVKPTDVPNLHLVVSGPLPANPIELLTSERMDGLVAFLKKNFDFVLFDTPPLLAVSDALAMGPMMDTIILVVRGGQTPVPALRQAKQKIDGHKLKCSGVILNSVDLVEQDGYYAHQYYDYSSRD